MSETVEKVVISLDNLNAVLSYLGKRPAEEVLSIINAVHNGVAPYFGEIKMSNTLTEIRGRLQSYESDAKDEISKFLDYMHVVMNIDIAPVAGPAVVPVVEAPVVEAPVVEAPVIEAPVVEAAPVDVITDVEFKPVVDAAPTPVQAL